MLRHKFFEPFAFFLPSFLDYCLMVGSFFPATFLYTVQFLQFFFLVFHVVFKWSQWNAYIIMIIFTSVLQPLRIAQPPRIDNRNCVPIIIICWSASLIVVVVIFSLVWFLVWCSTECLQNCFKHIKWNTFVNTTSRGGIKQIFS